MATKAKQGWKTVQLGSGECLELALSTIRVRVYLPTDRTPHYVAAVCANGYTISESRKPIATLEEAKTKALQAARKAVMNTLQQLEAADNGETK